MPKKASKPKELTSAVLDKALKRFDDDVDAACVSVSYSNIETADPEDLYSAGYRLYGTVVKFTGKNNIMLNMDRHDADILLVNLESILSAEYRDGSTDTERYQSLQRTRDKLIVEATYRAQKKPKTKQEK